MIVVDEEGQETTEYVTTVQPNDGTFTIEYHPQKSVLGLPMNTTLYPGLNCLQQDDDKLIAAIKERVLIPPSTSGQEDENIQIVWITLTLVIFCRRSK